MYCRSAVLYSWLLVWVITDAWYFLLKAVWLYQLKCWSGDFSLGEGSRDQQYCRGICVISLLTCVSLSTTYTQTFPFRYLERPRKVHIGVADPAQVVQNCDVRRYYYFMILKDQCWVISSMIYGDCCQICYSLTLWSVGQHQSDSNQLNLVNLPLSQLSGGKIITSGPQGLEQTSKYTYNVHLKYAS